MGLIAREEESQMISDCGANYDPNYGCAYDTPGWVGGPSRFGQNGPR